ncbi:hypothetical protein [Lutibacter sp.]|uniref:hypothetical protein n=1 Tax=Lutibacter sp. TaxID=1925666 RepID=UPI0025C5A348|nr:hypothetical protein [Lutibacter sp.]MBT8317284.1 hypothetical protein [Lutibacter sp.]
MVFWHKFTTFNSGLPHEHGKSGQDLINHAIEVTGLIFGGAATTNLDDSEVAIAYSLSDKNTWKGEVVGFETEWEQPGNWTAGHVPLASEEVLIPGGLTHYPSLTASSNAVVGTLEIEIGASITANSYMLTVKGSGGAWNNRGDFIAGTGKVLFDHGVPAEIMTIAGSTDFYDIEVGPNTTMKPVPGNILRIENVGSADMTSIVDFSSVDNTVEWNGADQTIVNPNGIDGNSGYYRLILSGSGTKTMPTTAMNITDELVLNGPISATAQSSISIGNELEILGGATFATSAFNHSVGGHFDVGGHLNEGTFIPTAGYSITLNGSEVQHIYGSNEINFENLIIDNSTSIEVFTDITLNGNLTLTNGILDVGATNLTINGGLMKTSGYIEVNSSSSLTFGGTTALTLPASLFFSTPSVNNLTVNRTGGLILNSNLTVHGVLNLESANPLSTIGALDMGASTLSMDENATTIGIGDVTGIVKREHTFNVNTEYSFGSQFTTVDFTDGNTAPTWISVKISIGSIPTWTPWSPSPNGKIKRLYQFACSDNSSIAQTNINMRYLLSELDLTYNNEEELIFWHKLSTYDSGTPHEHGKSNQDITNHIMGLTGLIFGTWATDDLDDSQIAMAYTLTAKNTWKGEVLGYETEWEQPQNWTAGYVPLSTDDVLIPGGLSYYPSLTASANAVAQSIEIAVGGSISANSYTITISGSSGAWINQGTFNAGTGKVLFNHGVPSEIVTIAGTTNFYDIEVAENTTMQPTPGAITRISGTGTAYMTSLVDFSTVNNTVEWNGANQTIVNPTGIGGGSGYYNLIISGTGTKTMPTTAMTINGDFSTSGTASIMVADSLYIKGNTTISLGSIFENGSETHILEGNFENNGTFTAASNGTIIFSGETAQTISGSSITNFDKLTINNSLGVTQESDINVNNVLTFNDGNLNVGANTLGINGTISNPSGNIEVSSSSSLSFGGTTGLTLNDNLFNGNPTINNLTINRSGGVTLGNESITINGTLALTVGTITIGENTLTLAGASPTRTSGTIDASNSQATLAFENSAAITLPASLFSTDVNNLTINGSGGITAGDDITINGVLDLQSANPSASKGSLDMSSYTLDMEEDATTIGQGDVSGIIRRTSIVPNKTYSFGHQYSTISFPDVGTLPTEISLKVTLGSAPSWRTGAIERVYDLIQTGGSGTQALIKNHYLDSELNGRNENSLGEWMYIIPSTFTIDYGRSGSNTNENWITISNVNIGVFASVFGVVEIGMDEYENTNLTWNGSTSTSWVTASNWTPMGAPSDDTVITIPAGTPNDLSIPEIAICGEMIIETGAIVNSISGGQLTVTGSGSAWVNNGTFNPDTGTVIFSHGDETETVTISGTTNFNNLALANKTYLQPDTNCIIGIAGLVSADSRSVFDFDTYPNTVVYNGEKEQDIINPGGGHNYYNLSLSVDGTKILPATDFQIVGDFSLSGNANTTSYYDLTVGADLNLSETSILTMDAVTSLTVSGAIVNTAGSEGFILQSNINGTASLIHSSDNVPATIERYISGVEEDWHFLSSPVSNQTIIGSNWVPSGTYGNGTGYDLYVWDEPTPCWVYQLNTTTTPNWPTVHPSTSFVPGRGYLYSVQDLNPTNNFEGNLNNGTISYPLTANNSEDLTLTGFNLIGNPYPCAIDWKASTGWTRSNLLDSGGGYDMWIWNPAANNYGVFNSAGTVGTNDVTQYIASMQGFFVRAESNANIVMTNEIRLHTGASNWMKLSNTKHSVSNVKVKIASDSGFGFDEVLLQFGHSENMAGAAKLFSTADNAPSVYMLKGKEELSVKYVTDTIDNPFVPLVFKPGSDGDYSLNIDVDDINFEYVILEDKKSKKVHNLLENPIYQFNSSINDDPNRFVIHFTNKVVSSDANLSALVYYDGNDIIVDLSIVPEQTEVVIYDMLGRSVINESLQGETIHRLFIHSKNQIYIVSAKSENKIIRKKVLVY